MLQKNSWRRFVSLLSYFVLMAYVAGCESQAPVVNYNNTKGETGVNSESDKTESSIRFSHEPSENVKTETTKTNPLSVAEQDGFDPVDISATVEESRINILAWNVESDGNNPETIARQLKGMKGFSLFALSEVRGQPSADTYIKAVKESWGNAEGLLGKTGREDALLFIFDPKVFELMKVEELDELNPEMKYRSPHVVTLKHIESGELLLVVNNHLARGNADNRNLQAAGLREWARKQTLPVIAVGDYNFDFVFETKEGNREFVEFMRDGIWKWIKPDEWVDSNWYDQAGDGEDDYPGSLLDFAFVAGPAKDWTATCNVLAWEGDFPDDNKTSDHRPVELSLQIRK